MYTFKGTIRWMVSSLLLGTVYLSLGGLALAWNAPLWVRQLGTAEENDSATGVATDPAGDVYIAGNSFDGNDLYAWVAKYSPAGALRWKQLGTKKNEEASGVAADSAGNVYIAGDISPPEGYSDVWVAKYSSAGVLRWKKQLGTNDVDYVSGVATDPTGNVIIAGGTFGSLGGPNLKEGYRDGWLATYSPVGTLRWKRQYAYDPDGWGDEADEVTSVAADGDGNVYIAGSTHGDFYTGNVIAKYSPNGAFLWQKLLWPTGYPYSSHSIYDMVVDKQKSIYISGQIFDNDTGAENDAFVAKFLPTGAMHWQRVPDVVEPAYASGIAADAFGNVYIAGAANLVDWSEFGDAFVAKYSTRR